jgi:hypothetical protein
MIAAKGDATAVTRPLKAAPTRDLEALGQQAKLHHDRIVGRSITAARDYWLLGSVLEDARDAFRKGRTGEKTKGKWYQWLKKHTISRHRADRARLLAAAFSTLQDLEGLTLEDGMALARQHRSHSGQKLAKRLRRRLDDIAKSIERTADEAESLGQERADLLAKADRLAQAIVYFRRTCATLDESR